MARYRRSVRTRSRLFRRRRTARRIKRSRFRRRRRITVSRQWEGPLLGNSLVPQARTVMGSSVGVDGNDFMTWNITPFVSQDNGPLVGGFGRHYNYDVANASPLYRSSTEFQQMITDLPICINSSKLESLAPSNFWTIYDEYRIAYVNLSFTVPEYVDDKNNCLYIEWTNLPNARAATPNDVMNFLIENISTNPVTQTPTAQPGTATPEDISDSFGWNWICRPKDICDATSREGKASQRYGWHRSLLTYTHPVTISFRPRHADIHYDANAVSCDYGGNTAKAATPVDNYAISKYLNREFLPILRYRDNTSDMEAGRYTQFWMGPIVRLIDANRLSTGNKPTGTLYEEYGIRVSWSIGVNFRGLSGTKEIFPNYYEAKV